MEYFIQTIFVVLRYLLIVVPILLAVAYLTIAERKVIGGMQRREGPTVNGPFGTIQAFNDALKLIVKENIIPSNANKIIFLLAPILTFGLSVIGWAVMPLSYNNVSADLNIGVLYILAVSSLSVYGVICSGWSSNSKYAFLGGLRSTAQMISYEVSFGLILINVFLFTHSLNLTEIILYQRTLWFAVPLFPIAIMLFISSVAETNRPPFDLPEAEAELVAGYYVEYSAIGFVLFFIGEYAAIIFMSILNVVMFMGGFTIGFINSDILSGISFGIKLCFYLFLFIWIRVALPRYRYDQLMRLGWKVLLPVSLAFVIFYAVISEITLLI